MAAYVGCSKWSKPSPPPYNPGRGFLGSLFDTESDEEEQNVKTFKAGPMCRDTEELYQGEVWLSIESDELCPEHGLVGENEEMGGNLTDAPLKSAQMLTSPPYKSRTISRTPEWGSVSPTYGPKSPCYCPKSPGYYQPTSPAYSPNSPVGPLPSSQPGRPVSPQYCPESPNSGPNSPIYYPDSPCFRPASPYWAPQSPGYKVPSPAPIHMDRFTPVKETSQTDDAELMKDIREFETYVKQKYGVDAEGLARVGATWLQRP